jgi:hypothetical protein
MMIQQQISLFFFVLSIIYTLRFVVELVIRLVQDEPEPLVLNKYEQFAHYVALSYIITYLLT